MDENIIAFDALKTRILKYILYKKRTEQEVRMKFHDVQENMLEDAIEYLKEAGYINDEDYVKRAIYEFMNLKNLSLKEIYYKLMAKGINASLIDEFEVKNMDVLYEYEKKSAQKIFLKKKNLMEEKDIIFFLKKKGYREESICYVTEGNVLEDE